MTVLPRFSSPAGQAEKDFANDPTGLEAFNQTWNTNLNSWTEIAIVGNPWSSKNDFNRYFYYNPLSTDIPDGSAPTPIPWTAFPNRLFSFFYPQPNMTPPPPALTLTPDQIFAVADMGCMQDNTPLGQVQVPTNPELCSDTNMEGNCPGTNWQGDKAGYTPPGPRGWLDEYCEWSVKRDENGKLRQVMFTCENPAYWFNLWRHSPALVTQLYQTHINPNVQEADLYLRDSDGNPVVDPLLNYYAYDPTNKWNNGTQTEADHGGAMHLTSAPNTLAAEIYLAAAGTIPRTVGNNLAQCLICATWYGRPQRNSDPFIGQTANRVANGGTLTPPHVDPTPDSLMLSLTDPVGLYIQMPETTRWHVKKTKPNGDPYGPDDFWQVTRGYADPDPKKQGQGYDSILHAVFTVPDELQPEDITIDDTDYYPQGEYPDGRPLEWAGQIARTFKIALRATGIPVPSGVELQKVKDKVPNSVPSSDPYLQPWPEQFVSSVSYQAGSVDDAPAYVKQGTTTEMALVVGGGLEHASIQFIPPDGIEPVTIKQFIQEDQTYIFDLIVSPDAPLGERQIQVRNLDKQVLPEQERGAPGWLIITG